jgi:uncharacterized protein YjiS (DUF1127 family)
MAVLETVRPAPMGAITIHRAVVSIDRVVDGLKAWNQRRRTVAALQKLTPAQLGDIGLDGVDLGEYANALGRR